MNIDITSLTGDGCGCLEVLACSYGEDKCVIFVEKKEE